MGSRLLGIIVKEFIHLKRDMLALVLALVGTQRSIDARLGTFRAQEESLYLWSALDWTTVAPCKSAGV